MGCTSSKGQRQAENPVYVPKVAIETNEKYSLKKDEESTKKDENSSSLSTSSSRQPPTPLERDTLLDSFSFPATKLMICHNEEEKGDGLCSCDNAQWSSMLTVVGNSRDGQELFAAIDEIRKQVDEKTTKNRILRREEALNVAMREQQKQKEIVNDFEKQFATFVVSSTEEIASYNRYGLKTNTDRSGERYFAKLHEHFELITREKDIWNLANEESSEDPPRSVDENAFTLEQCTHDLLLVDRTRTAERMNRAIEKRNHIAKRMQKVPMESEHATHFLKFIEAHNNNLSRFRDCLSKDDPSSIICEEMAPVEPRTIDKIKLVAKKLKLRIVFKPKSYFLGFMCHYRTSYEQDEYEKKHNEVFEETKKNGINFKSEHFKIPEHVDHFKKYLQTHQKNLDAFQLLVHQSES